jgi:glycosyltransferase A (GT-A) superfamily protein (DUF2064 family)
MSAADRAGFDETGHQFGTVLVIAKEPVAGRVKTRLTPPFSPAQAADLAAAAIADTLAAARAVPADAYVLVLDGAPGDWVPPGWHVVAQVSGGLDARLTAAFAAATGPTVLVGMDTPQLRPDQLIAFRPDRFEACIGLAVDGGFWAIGFADPADAARVIPGVPMSRDDTGARQCDRIRDAGLSLQLLDELVDVDTAVEARAVATATPHTRFARRWAEINPGAA